MSLDELKLQYAVFEQQGDHKGAARMLRERPELLTDRNWLRVTMNSHALMGEIDFIRNLLDAGVDLNTPEDDLSLTRPIYSAVHSGSAEMVRMLLDRGSDVNWATSEHPIQCLPLPTAIRDGRLDIVRMLVEAGALLNVIGPAGHTPLSWALAYRQQEIAEYLKAHGALLPHETPGWVPPPPERAMTPMEHTMQDLGVKMPPEPIATQGGMTVRIGNGPNDPDRILLFTDGMSDHAMTVPEGGEAYRYAELVQYICLFTSMPCEIEDLGQLDWANFWMVD